MMPEETGVYILSKSSVTTEERALWNRDAVMRGYAYCANCGDAWTWKLGHTTYFEPCRGMSPLCEECWRGMSVRQRMPFYMALCNMWDSQDVAGKAGSDVRKQVRAAVLAEPVFDEVRAAVNEAAES